MAQLSFNDILNFSVKHNIDMNVLKDKKKNTILHIACLNPHIPSSTLIELVKHLEVIQDLNDAGSSPFHLAFRRKPSLELVKSFIQKGYKADSKSKHGRVSVHLACANNASMDVIKYLVEECKCDINLKSDDGNALDLALSSLFKEDNAEPQYMINTIKFLLCCGLIPSKELDEKKKAFLNKLLKTSVRDKNLK